MLGAARGCLVQWLVCWICIWWFLCHVRVWTTSAGLYIFFHKANQPCHSIKTFIGWFQVQIQAWLKRRTDFITIKRQVHLVLTWALCPCGLEAQTTAHVLQPCPLHKRERESTWPTENSLRNKLHGTAADLRLTVRFIALTGLQIKQVYTKRWRRRTSTKHNLVIHSADSLL